MVNRFDVWLTDLNPTEGSESKKTRPCAIVSPDEMIRFLNTVIIVPMTTSFKAYPSRLPCSFSGKGCELVVDQIRSVDKGRLFRKLGKLDQQTCVELCELIQETFSFE